MKLILDTEEITKFEHKFHNWFFSCLNDIVPQMVDESRFNPATDRDYRDRCARYIKKYVSEHPMPTWKTDL